MYTQKDRLQQKKYYTSEKGRKTRKAYQDKYYKGYYQKTSEKKKLQTRKYRLKSNFGITLEVYNQIFDSQNGKCAVCKKISEGKMLAVDHDHETGKVRGLLCQQCNTAFGSLGDNIQTVESLLAYAKHWKRRL